MNVIRNFQLTRLRLIISGHKDNTIPHSFPGRLAHAYDHND